MKIEINNGELYYTPSFVIYKGRTFKAPVSLTTLLAYDYLLTLAWLKK